MGWVARKIERVVELTGLILLVIITCLAILQVLVRYVIKIPLIWTDELARFLFIWMVWVGAVLGMAKGNHMVIEYFRDRFFGTKALGTGIKVIMQISSLVFLLLVVAKGWSLAQAVSREYYVTFPISYKYTYLVAVVCGGLMAYYLFLELWRTWKELRARGKKC